MKRIVLSRKGFDSSTGKKPNKASPIYEDGKIFSIPIQIDKPDPDPHTYEEVNYLGVNAFEAIRYAHQKRPEKQPYLPNDHCHFDPNLSVSPGLFGQHGNAQSDLDGAGIDTGDLFLFFGWFKTFHNTPSSEDFIDAHHFFGWLQISEIIRGTDNIRIYCEKNKIKHPHAVSNYWKPNNTMYVGSKDLKSNYGLIRDKGSGLFDQTNRRLVLNKSKKKSLWQLPLEYFSEVKHSKKSESMFINGNKFFDKNRFNTEKLTLDTNLGYWQEMVLNSEEFPTIEKWAYDLINELG